MSPKNSITLGTAVVFFLHIIPSARLEQKELTLDDLKAISCTEEKPFLCVPDGACCKGSEFCHNGLCENCFPKPVRADPLAWCRKTGQFNTSAMRHPTQCRFACQDLYNSTLLAVVDSSQNESWSCTRVNDTLTPNATTGDSANASLTYPSYSTVVPYAAISLNDNSGSLDAIVGIISTVLVCILIMSAGLVYIIWKVKGLKKFVNTPRNDLPVNQGGSNPRDGNEPPATPPNTDNESTSNPSRTDQTVDSTSLGSGNGTTETSDTASENNEGNRGIPPSAPHLVEEDTPEHQSPIATDEVTTSQAQPLCVDLPQDQSESQGDDCPPGINQQTESDVNSSIHVRVPGPSVSSHEESDLNVDASTPLLSKPDDFNRKTNISKSFRESVV